MHLIFNDQILLEEELRLPISNRAFQYSDGFFETIILKDGQVRFWAQHWERIQEAAAALHLVLPSALVDGTLPRRMVDLAQLNSCGPLARVKLKIWRTGAGLYTPQSNEADWLLTSQPAMVPAEAPLQVGVCDWVRTIPSPFSSFKGINAPVYVLASKEKEAYGLDDMIILDPQGHLAELTYSNLFWLSGETLFTPSLETGCLNGVVRRNLLQLAKQHNLQVEEGQYLLDQLSLAKVAFAGNVTGVRVITMVNGINLPQESHPFFKMVKALF